MNGSTMGTSTDTTCHFLKLPAELRNRIYGLAFTTAADTEEHVYFTSEPPSKAIISTCKQVYSEANKLYQHTYRRFWRESSFEIPSALAKHSSQIIQHGLRDEDLAAITKVTIDVAGPENPDSFMLSATLEGGVWHHRSRSSGSIYYQDIAVAEGRKLGDTDGVYSLVSGFKVLSVMGETDPEQLQEIKRKAGRTRLTRNELLVWLYWYRLDRDIRVEEW